MYLWWRFFYWLIDTDAVVALSAAAVDIVGLFKGDPYARNLVEGFGSVVYSGWPHHERGWINLHLSRFSSKLRARFDRSLPVPRLRAGSLPARPVRVGIVGRFRGALGFPISLFAGAPGDIELHVFDIPFAGAAAPYLEALCARYVSLPLEDGLSAHGAASLARAINDSQLDFLVNVHAKQDVYRLMDDLETPCIANYCSGCDIIHHQNVDFQIYCQPQADYFVREDRLFCGTTRSFFSDQFMGAFSGYFDLRGLDLSGHPDWRAREPLCVFHGSLYKLASPHFLRQVFGLLLEDSTLEFVFMGKDDGQALSTIRSVARERGVEARVHYEGQFDSTRDASGNVADPGWIRMVSYLKRARLSPDPWPLGGASSRFETYALGVPSVSIALKVDPSSWGRPQELASEVPSMHVPLGRASSVDQYMKLCRKCLYDEDYATRLAAEQTQMAKRLADPALWWNEILQSYCRWRSRAVAGHRS